MGKKKNTKSVIPKDKERKKLYQIYLSKSYDMSPYNAAIKAGYSHNHALYLEKHAPIDIKDERGRWDGNRFALNVIEQEGFTIRRSIRRMIEKAGLVDGIEGANKIISAQVIIKSDNPDVKSMKANSRTNDFVEVPDEDVRYKYHMKLNEMVGLVKSESNGDAAQGNVKPYNIQINILSENPKPEKGGGNGAGVEIREV